MSRIRMLPGLIALTLTLCLASSADARKWRSRHHGYDYSGFFRDENRWPPAQARQTRTEARSTRTAQPSEAANRTVGVGPFTTLLEDLARACLQQVAQFQAWPFDEIVRIAAPNDTQRGALDELRGAAAAAAEKVSADCPKEVSAPAWARLDLIEQSIDAASAAFAAIEPALQGFYKALDDEQKARLLRDLSPSNSQARGDERAPEQRGNDERGSKRWSNICERLTAALRGWPTSEIERGVRLSEQQRVALYELVTTSLKAAEALARACPADNALTPVGRVATLRVRLAAVRQATSAIHPALTRFYDALDQEQRVLFAAMR